MTKTTIIQHPEYGRVEGVTRSYTYEPWWKEERGGRMYYFESKGWKEVLSKRDVTGECMLLEEKTGRKIIDLLEGVGVELTNGKRLWFGEGLKGRKVKAVVLPEGMSWEEWLRKYYMLSQFSLKELLSTHTTTVIQVWQEGE